MHGSQAGYSCLMAKLGTDNKLEDVLLWVMVEIWTTRVEGYVRYSHKEVENEWCTGEDNANDAALEPEDGKPHSWWGQGWPGAVGLCPDVVYYV